MTDSYHVTGHNFNLNRIFKSVSEDELEHMFNGLINSGMTPDEAGIKTVEYEIYNNYMSISGIKREKPVTFGDAIDLTIAMMNEKRIEEDCEFIFDDLPNQMGEFIDSTWLKHRNKLLSEYDFLMGNGGELNPQMIQLETFNDAIQAMDKGPLDTVDSRLLSIAVSDTMEEIRLALDRFVFVCGADTTIRMYDDNVINLLIVNTLIKYYLDHSKYLPVKIEFHTENEYSKLFKRLFEIGYESTLYLREPHQKFNINETTGFSISHKSESFPFAHMSIVADDDTYISIHFKNVQEYVRTSLIKENKIISDMAMISEFDNIIAKIRDTIKERGINGRLIIDDEITNPTADEFRVFIRIASKFDDSTITLNCTSTQLFELLSIAEQNDVCAIKFNRIAPTDGMTE